MAAVILFSDFGAQENKVCHCFHFSQSICHEVIGLDALIFVFLMLSFKPAFSLSSLTFIKELFSSSSLCAIKVELSAYLILLLFRAAILIPASASCSLIFFTMYWQYTALTYSFSNFEEKIKRKLFYIEENVSKIGNYLVIEKREKRLSVRQRESQVIERHREKQHCFL